MKRWPKYIFGICMIILVLSCRSQKPLVDNTDQTEVIRDGLDMEGLLARRHSFQTIKFKRMDIDFMINEFKENFNGNMAIYRDSLIVISIVPLFGYEALRIMCTRDSMIVINRKDKNYHASSLELYLEKYNIPVGFFDLQAALINEAFYYKFDKNERKYKKEVKKTEGGTYYNIEALVGNNARSRQQITTDDENFSIQDIIVVDYKRGIDLNVKYDDFRSYEKDYFPGRIVIDIKDRTNKIYLALRYGQVLFDEKINVEFDIPENYSRIHL